MAKPFASAVSPSTYPERRDGDELFPAAPPAPPLTWCDRVLGLTIGAGLLAAYWWSLAL